MHMEANESIRNPVDESIAPVYDEGSSSNFLTLKYVTISALILILGFVGGIYFSRNFPETPNRESSTQSAPLPTSATSISPTPESDEMEEWKTYLNEEYGYSLKYPPVSSTTTCKLQDADFPSQREEEGISYVSVLPGDPCGPGFRIAHHSNRERLEPLEFFKSRFQKLGIQLSCTNEQFEEFNCATIENNTPLTEEYRLTKKIISNRIGYQIDPVKILGESSDEIIIPAGQSQMIVITFHESKLTNQILSTFEFVDGPSQ